MIRLLLVSMLLNCVRVVAADAQASDASIREMLAVAEVRKLVDGLAPQFDAMMRASMQQAFGGRSLSVEEQKITDAVSTKMAALMKSELNWEKLEPLYLSIYQKSFIQEEVDGMLAFYKTPAGSAMIKKMPLVMKYSMDAMQERMGPLMQKVQLAVQEVVAEVEAGKKDAANQALEPMPMSATPPAVQEPRRP